MKPRFIPEPLGYRVEFAGRVVGWVNQDGLEREWWPHRHEGGDFGAPPFPTRREAAEWLVQQAENGGAK